MTIKGDEEVPDNSVATSAEVEHHLLRTLQIQTVEATNQKDFFPDDNLVLGRWVLVDSKTPSFGANFKTGEMIITRQVNEKTGMVEYHTNSLLKWRICGCCPMSTVDTSIRTFTSNDTFTEIGTEKAWVSTKISATGRRVAIHLSLNLREVRPEKVP